MKYIKYSFFILSLFISTALFSQPITNYWKAFDVLDTAQKKAVIDSEKKRLHSIIQTVKSLDPYYKSNCVQWLIDGSEVKITILKQLRDYFNIYDLNYYTELMNKAQNNELFIRVIREPVEGTLSDEFVEDDPNFLPEIIGLFIDDKYAIIGYDDISTALGSNLYPFIQDRTKYHYTNITDYGDKNKQYSHISASLFGGEAVLFLNSIKIMDSAGKYPTATSHISTGIKIDIGYDMINYPMWYGGVWNIKGFYAPTTDQSYSIGAILPFRPGQTGMKIFGPVKLNSRRLNGAYGISGDASVRLFEPEDVNIPIFNKKTNIPIILGVDCSYSTLNDNKGDELLVNGRGSQIKNWIEDFYYIVSNFHAFLGFKFPGFIDNFRLDLGYGMFQVKNSILSADGLTFVDYYNSKGDDPLHTLTSFYAKVSYKRTGVTNYALSLQYFNNSAMLYGNLELFPWLHLEAKYAKVFGTQQPWEDKEFITVTPKFILKF
jgi:hypothetical protein